MPALEAGMVFARPRPYRRGVASRTVASKASHELTNLTNVVCAPSLCASAHTILLTLGEWSELALELPGY